MLGAYVTNLGKYNEGILAFALLKFPTTTEEVQALLKRIGIDGVRYEEIFITDYETDIPGLYDALGEYESIDELNYLAALLEELSPGELELFEAVMAAGLHNGSLQEIINMVQNLDCFDFHPGVDNKETLGRIYAEDFEMLDIPEEIKDYFDYEAYGRDMAINESGRFVNGGYLLESGTIKEFYSGRDDIPEEYRVFAYPKMPIREVMAAYKELADSAPRDTEKQHNRPDRAER